MMQPTSIEIPSFKAFHYRQVWEITEIRNNCIYKTKPVGYIHVNDIVKYPTTKYVVSSISTGLLAGAVCVLSPYLSAEKPIILLSSKYSYCCKNCNGNMVGDGYRAVLHCENAEWEDFCDKEPDADPVYCKS